MLSFIANVSGQAKKLVHCSNLFHNEWSGELAELLVKATIQHGGMGFPEADPSSSKPVSYDDQASSGLKVFFTSAYLLCYIFTTRLML